MHRLPACLLAAVIAIGITGCANTVDKPSEATTEKHIVQDAPLGSRIRKKTGIAPVTGATREDMERAKIQQGAIETGIYQKAP